MKWAVWRYLHDVRDAALGWTVDSEEYIDGVPTVELPSETGWFFQQAQCTYLPDLRDGWGPAIESYELTRREATPVRLCFHCRSLVLDQEPYVLRAVHRYGHYDLVTCDACAHSVLEREEARRAGGDATGNGEGLRGRGGESS